MICEIIEPYYPKKGKGREPDATTLLRFRHLLEEYGLNK